MSVMTTRWILAGSILLLSSTFISTLDWQDDQFGGQLKWSSNCDFDGNFGDYSYENKVDDNPVRLIGQQASQQLDCGWLCWADVRCHYFSHSGGMCRTMSPARARIISNPSTMAIPYLADGDTICGFVPARVRAAMEAAIKSSETSSII